MAKPPLGTFVIHDNAVPQLPAGDYRVVTTHDLAAAKTSEIAALNETAETLTTHIEVSAPRFLLPADQILSTFPPNQAFGSFSSRLPQIVLKRRTLPWERKLHDAKNGDPPRSTPWMALVVLADAEAQLFEGPIAQCVTPGVTLNGPSDVTSATAVKVTETVVRQVFPAKSELSLLTHVREVDVSDTELAMGDDDGYLAVVMANRLPQPGVRYRACLISLEGQYDVMPDPGVVAEDFSSVFVYPDAIRKFDQIVASATGTVDHSAPVAATFTSNAQLAIPHTGASSVAHTVTKVDAWSSGPASAIHDVSPPPRNTVKTNELLTDLHGIDLHLVEPFARIFTFPVLAHWTFSCTDAGNFRSLALGLDVGMLGTLEHGDAPDAPTVLDTGHIELGLTDRGGEARPVWYRGPLTPRPVTRRQPDGDRLPLFHASDQARMIGPDGRENLSLATAFEIGRLLALAEPAVVAGFLNWRKDGFNAARRSLYMANDIVLQALDSSIVGRGFAAVAGAYAVSQMGADTPNTLGVPRPIVDAGRPMRVLSDGDPIEVLAKGLAISSDVVKELRDRPSRLSGPVHLTPVEQVGLEELAHRSDELLHPLRLHAVQHAAFLAGLTVGIGTAGSLSPSLAGGDGAEDALDRLIARLEEGTS